MKKIFFSLILGYFVVKITNQLIVAGSILSV